MKRILAPLHFRDNFFAMIILDKYFSPLRPLWRKFYNNNFQPLFVGSYLKIKLHSIKTWERVPTWLPWQLPELQLLVPQSNPVTVSYCLYYQGVYKGSLIFCKLRTYRPVSNRKLPL